MEDYQLVRGRTVSFAVVVGMMGFILAALCFLLFELTRQVGQAGPDVRSALVKLAWVCAALIALMGVLIVWAVSRYVRFRMGLGRPGRPMAHVDAWTEAGKRFKLEPSDKEGEGNDEE